MSLKTSTGCSKRSCPSSKNRPSPRPSPRQRGEGDSRCRYALFVRGRDCWAALFNSRFGAFISRFTQQNYRFAQLRDLACKGLIWLTVFGDNRTAIRENRENSRFDGKNRECSAIRAAGAVGAVSSRRRERRAARGHRHKAARRSEARSAARRELGRRGCSPLAGGSS
jgi:hypothetical protein